MNPWIDCNLCLPPEDAVVETKIDDANGLRMRGDLVRHRGLWFFPDLSMYVYYRPTHWRINPERVKELSQSNALPG